MDDFRQRLGQRIRTARTTLSLTQQQLAHEASLPAPQVVSQIEKGEREVKAWELVNISRVLRIDIGDLLREEDPARRALVLWREGPVQDREVREAQFAQDCERYALLEQLCGQCTESELPMFTNELVRLSYEDVGALADQTREELDLGSRPARALAGVLEDRYGVKIWYRPLGADGSAACTRGAAGPAMLLNSDEVPWRRNFSIAHELFHLLTWERTVVDGEEVAGIPRSRVEQLANVFASALLLPGALITKAIKRRQTDRPLVLADLVELAREFDVSAEALLRRLQNLGVFDQETVERVRSSEAFRALDRSSRPASWAQPPTLPERYVRLGFTAYQKGTLSRARFAELLRVGLADLNSTLEEYGFDERQDYATELHTA